LTDHYEGKASADEYQAWLARKAARRDPAKGAPSEGRDL